MAIDTVDSLLDALNQHRLLTPGQLQEIIEDLRQQFPEPRALARQLLERDWLTPYQVNQVFRGRAGDLVVGPYLLLERLSHSGRGQTFKARHLRFNRVVALQVLRKESLADPDAIQEFHEEVQAASVLEHPNLVVAYDADSVGEVHFVSMEYVEGVNLDKLVKECGSLPEERASDYVRQAALGLEHIYQRGMIHGDLRPSNLIVRRRESDVMSLRSGSSSLPPPGSLLKIVGLTHLQQFSSRKASAQRLAAESEIAAAVDYMAPERSANAQDVDIRADLYSLGCVAYYLLTAREPFPGGTPAEKVQRHRSLKPVAIQRLRPGISEAVIAVVDKLLAKRPENRYQTPAEVVAALAPPRA
jgi:serine/threonine-protein kinase